MNSQESSNSETREDSNSQKREELIPAPQPIPIHKLSTTSMVRDISTGQPGLPAWLCSVPAPAHLLISWTWETEKSPWFHSNAWKLPCYQHFPHTKPRPWQLLRGKLTPSQSKPGQTVSSNFQFKYTHCHFTLKPTLSLNLYSFPCARLPSLHPLVTAVLYCFSLDFPVLNMHVVSASALQ